MMGDSSVQIDIPQPKPSRFQFVPVPGEFTRGRWKCRDSYHPYAETLEFEKNKTKEDTNPDKISVFFKLKNSDIETTPSDTIQVTSIENNISENVFDNNSTESIIITRTNGVTIVRKTSCSLAAEGYDKIRELSIDDFENKPEKPPQIPPTPMNTPPATMLDASIGESVTLGNPALFQTTSGSVFSDKEKNSSSLLNQLLPECQLEMGTNNHPEKGEATRTITTNEPTFQVIQTEESRNMSMDSVKNAINVQAIGLANVHEVEFASEVLITVSAALEKKEAVRETTDNVGKLDACGIPITAPPTAPHSTPYGTPKDTQRSPTFDEAFSSVSPISVAAAINVPTAESSLPIDNKIEQAMELVKTHLTYAVREEVDTLRNTITELEYQMREYQFECNFYRQNCSPETVEQASSFVRQQMSKFQQPARRSVSTSAVPIDGLSHCSVTNTSSSTHMRNLQTQIQQIKQIVPGGIAKDLNEINASQ